MPNDHCFDAVPTPPLSDEAVVYIHDALHNYLDLFERHYGDQIRRYYDERAQHQMLPPTPSDEPF
ncbi:MAG: hypothetical protein ACRETN_04890 [Nevskiales bacterium]